MMAFLPFLVLFSSWIYLIHPSAAYDLLETCQSKGFNPLELSCETCQLLKDVNPLHFEACQQCCQAYKDTKNTATRYGAAIFLHYPAIEEMDNFVKDDLPNMDKKSQITVVQQQGESDQMRYLMGFMQKSCSILWLDKKPAVSITASTNIESLRKMAKEEIDLRGWKRDDVKSMLETLLV